MKSVSTALALIFTVQALAAAPSTTESRTVARWQKKLRKLDQSIESGDYEGALKSADKLILVEMVPSLLHGEAGADLLALATVYKALAESGLEQTEAAVWHWHIAQNLDPDLRQVSLVKFGPTAHLLEYNRLRLAHEPPRDLQAIELDDPEQTPIRPRALETPYPMIPESLQTYWYDEKTEIEVVIDRTGRVRSPVVLEGRLPGKIYLGLEAMRVWKYRPALLDGEPVAVFLDFEDFYEKLAGASTD